MRGLCGCLKDVQLSQYVCEYPMNEVFKGMADFALLYLDEVYLDIFQKSSGT
jgi:hypothetical protein